MFITRESLSRRALSRGCRRKRSQAWRFASAALAALAVCGSARAAQTAEVAEAAMRGDHVELRSLLEHGADVNAAQGDGMTALHWAAVNADLDVAKWLVYAGANVHATTRLNAIAPLWLAAQSGDALLVRLLLDNKAEPDAATATGVTPLMIAAAAGNPIAVGLLIERGADPDAKEKTYGQTPLIFAAAYNRPDAIAVLLEHGANVAAATKVRPSADELMGGLTGLHYAVRQGNVEAVDALLDRGADVNSVSADSTTPLMLATINGRFDLAMHLLERGGDPTIATAAGATPLYRVIDVQWAPKSAYPQPPGAGQQQTGYLELMKALLERGADPNARLRKALWYTRYSSGLGGTDPAGATPFWRASEVGDVDAMRLLVAHGADPSVKTLEGVSPLMVLAGAGHQGNDAITIPAGRMPALRYLVEELGANVNETDEIAGAKKKIEHVNTRGYTPIHNAAARGDNEMILYLVSKGARVNLVGKNGVTSVDLASSPGDRIEPFPETIKLLESLGAKSSRPCAACRAPRTADGAN
jgi:ankyrin repeat protein